MSKKESYLYKNRKWNLRVDAALRIAIQLQALLDALEIDIDVYDLLYDEIKGKHRF